ncbi:MAG: DNA repair protein RecO [Bacteroidota bacterium]
MLHATKGIVFHSVRYSETSVIVTIYTELFGIQSYLFKGVRSARSKIKPALFQPLTLLDLVVYHKEKHALQHVKEIHLAHPYQSIPFDIRKSSVALFINELVYKTIREEEANPDLFEFLWTTCMQLDETSETVSSFHLFFSLQFCHFLGIFPLSNYSDQLRVFNLREGLFQASLPDHRQYLDHESSRLFFSLVESCSEYPAGNSETAKWRNSEIFLHMNAETRDQLLETILLYYRLHLPGFKGLQSHLILRDVMA